MRRIVLLSYLLLAVLSISSCGKDQLSRATVNEILTKNIADSIKKSEGVPSDMSLQILWAKSNGEYQIVCSYKDCTSADRMWLHESKNYLNLRDAGLITITPVWFHPYNWDGRGNYATALYRMELTDKGRNYAKPDSRNNGYMLFTLFEFDKVTVNGLVQESPTKMIADFEIDLKLTPAGTVLLSETDQQGRLHTKARALFVKYDDGWRLSE